MKHLRRSGRKAAHFSAALCAVLLTAPGGAARGGELWAPGVSASFEPRFEREARRALEIYPPLAGEVSEALGIPAPQQVFLEFRSSPEFRESVGVGKAAWAAGVARPGENRIVLQANKLDLVNDLATLLKHEAVHLLLGLLEARTGRRIPIWFHEGVAQYLCARLFYGSREDFLAASATGRLHDFEDLSSSWPEEERAARLAYVQSEEFTAFLERRRPGALRALLKAFGEGRDFPEAFSSAFGGTLASAEAAWREERRRGPPFLVALLQDNPGLLLVLLFAAAGILVFVAWLRYRVRRKALLDALDD